MSTEPTAEEFDCRSDLPQELQEAALALLFLLDQKALGVEIADPFTQFGYCILLVRDFEPTEHEG